MMTVFFPKKFELKVLIIGLSIPRHDFDAGKMNLGFRRWTGAYQSPLGLHSVFDAKKNFG